MEIKLFKGGLILSVFVLIIYLYNNALIPTSTSDSNLETPLSYNNDKLAESETRQVKDVRQSIKTNEQSKGFIPSNEQLTRNTNNSQKLIGQVNTQYNEQEKLNIALAQIPVNYHNLFKWSGGEDSELINEYIALNETPENSAIDDDLETVLSAYIYQHEMSPNIIVERLSCSQTRCEIFGTESSSSAWSFIKEAGKNQAWWTFTKETTRNGVGADGELIFLTIIQK